MFELLLFNVTRKLQEIKSHRFTVINLLSV